MVKWVYSFGDGRADGSAEMKNLLGGKGANLAEMSSLGVPVPPGFTISTDVCGHYYQNDDTYPEELRAEVEAALAVTANTAGRVFGDPENPLLVSVRSGARASMPGMMDTILNLGLNDQTVVAVAKQLGHERFALDSYRRFIQMYSDVVLGVDHGFFEEILEDTKAAGNHELDTDLSSEELRGMVEKYKQLVLDESGEAFPQDPHDQLWGAIGAVFSSWMNQRAKVYRRLHKIPAEWGTAVNVQSMVFGNMGDSSATGVAFTRNPSTGENKLYGEFLVNAQGEDVVAGIRTPQNLTEEARIGAGSNAPSLEKLMPEAFADFVKIADKLEHHYKDMQDLEFTIEDGKLWLLQTRAGKRTAKAALRTAAEMCNEGLLSKEEAIGRIEPASLDQLLHPTIAPNAERDVIGSGLPASPGAATGEIVFNSDEAEKMKLAGTPAILVRIETSPEDIHGMHASEGILTTRGGMTSHAAVVARGMGKPCVSGAGNILVDPVAQKLTSMGRTFNRGDIITVDGTTGQILAGSVEMVQPELSGDFGIIMGWADEVRRMGVRANAETAKDARTALSFGAEGIGLCRTEHMFFDGDRITAMREMILAEDEAGRRLALNKLLPMQRDDFVELFQIMDGLPITIRLLDPPLHEFLPHTDDDISDLVAASGLDAEALRQRSHALHESNPMLGHRGCRLAVTYPEIAEMQARAIFEAALAALKSGVKKVEPEIMVPLVSGREELDFVKAIIEAVAKEVLADAGADVKYTIGTMIELPRAALRAGDIAHSAEFFSFGTNDLTQTTFGISRDDAGMWLGQYETAGVIKADPFMTLDHSGVGELVQMGVERGRQSQPGIKLGVCGEHGGDPASIDFFEQVGLDYISCSPFRIPIARLAAAQAALKGKG